jgi:hypothetical protein
VEDTHLVGASGGATGEDDGDPRLIGVTRHDFMVTLPIVRRLLSPVWIFLDLLAAIALVFMSVFSPWVDRLLARHRRRSLGRKLEGRPILLVHGYGMSRGSMLAVGRWLIDAGCGPVYAAGYPWLSKLEEAGAGVAALVAQICAITGAERMDIVAHSLGGLVSRSARARAGSLVGRIVTLGTPHRGAVMGPLSVGGMHDVLCVGTDCDTPQVGDLAVVSEMDLVVRPSKASLAAPAETLFLDRAGHGAMLLSPGVARSIARHLSEPVRDVAA